MDRAHQLGIGTHAPRKIHRTLAHIYTTYLSSKDATTHRIIRIKIRKELYLIVRKLVL